LNKTTPTTDALDRSVRWGGFTNSRPRIVIEWWTASPNCKEKNAYTDKIAGS
jgi:hypothetical protein